EKRPEGRLFSNRPTRLFALLRVLPAVVMRELLANARRLSGALAQIIEFGTTYVALALDLDARDQRRVRLKCAFDTLAAGNLAHHKRRIQTAIALGDYHSLERLHALAFAFYNADADDDGIAR